VQKGFVILLFLRWRVKRQRDSSTIRKSKGETVKPLSLLLLASMVLKISGCSDSTSKLANADVGNSVGEPFKNKSLESEIEKLKTLPDHEEEELDGWLEIKKRCESSSGLRSIITKVDHGSETSGNIKYYYEYTKSIRSDAPLIIYIPGGPGLGSIGSHEFNDFSEYDVIHIDPRGVNCNFWDASFSSQFNTFQHANDILTVIKAEKPKKYIIYARSYGTVVATHLAELIERNHIDKPESIILEGVFGKHIDNWYESGLKAIKELVDITHLNDYLRKTKLELTDDQWGNYLHDAVSDPIQVFQMRDNLKELVEFPDNRELKKNITDQVLDYFEFRTPTYGGQLQTIKSVACRELFSSLKISDVLFHDGDLSLKPKDQADLCAGIDLSNPFDSAEFDFSSKLIYLQGHFDGQTGLAGARYHYELHKTNSDFLEIPMGGHTPSKYDSQFENCMPAFINRAFEGEVINEAELSGCMGKFDD
jgi:pimeloyl-ACP methyl ester carboxylesterase